MHLGCGDGTLSAAMRQSDSYIVHALDTDAENVANARESIRKLGLYGPVSVDRFDGRALPYAGNLVNLFVAEKLGNVSVDEVMRVLAPLGVAMIAGDKSQTPKLSGGWATIMGQRIEIAGETWTRIVNPWPEEIDE